MELAFGNGVATHATLDSTNNGKPDRREHYRDGAVYRVEADTNGDGRPDVTQEYEGGTVTAQSEDTDFDGTMDVRFENGKPVEMNTPVAAPSALPAFNCGEFSTIWR